MAIWKNADTGSSGRMNCNDPGKPASKTYILLHLNIMIFSFTGIFSKFAADSISARGLLSPWSLLWGFLILANCAVYAIFWQQNLKRFPVNVAYAHSAVYNIWSLIWAVLIFSETINRGNIIGTILIIAGILLIRGE